MTEYAEEWEVVELRKRGFTPTQILFLAAVRRRHGGPRYPRTPPDPNSEINYSEAIDYDVDDWMEHWIG
jgi:hypothetical protein